MSVVVHNFPELLFRRFFRTEVPRRGEALSAVLKLLPSWPLTPDEPRWRCWEARRRRGALQQTAASLRGVTLSSRPNMVTASGALLLTLVLYVVRMCQPVCVDVPSDTEAVLGASMKLTCIACLKREEIKAKTRVDWYYMPTKENGIPSNRTHIYKYEDERPSDLDGPFKGRICWNGSQDLQDLSIRILNVTYNDSGVYECHVVRQFEFDFFKPSVSMTKDIKLFVKEKATDDPTAFYSEIMMYVLLVFLTCWLLVEMVYCYRKISKSDEQSQDSGY